MANEDKIGKTEWSQWNKKEKVIFLTGFRIGSGPIVRFAPATTNITLTLHSQEFEDVAKRVDSFYADTANANVTIHGAIEIILMQLKHASTESVAKKLEAERTRILWGF